MFTKDSRILNHRLTVPLTSVSKAVGDVFKHTFNQFIKSIFANGEQGFAYDPNDLSTMFQDAAGTVPVTGAGQPVGLVLDNSRGVLRSSELISSVWTASSGAINNNNGVITFTSIAVGAYIENVMQVAAGKWYEVSFTVSNYSTGGVSVSVSSVQTLPVAQANTTYKQIFFATGPGKLKIVTRYGTTSLTLSNVSIKEIYGNHAYQTTSASRPILRQNATTGAYYLEFDGSDDFLVTSNINFTATDKVSLFAGVRKSSDVTSSIVFEFSSDWTSNAGSFVMHAPYSNGGANFYSGARGTATASLPLASTIVGTKYAAPVNAVVSAKHDISGDYSKMVVNGVNGSTAVADKGTGNFGSYPLYLGRRAGIASPFNGHIYSLIGVGKLASDNETAAIEKELAKRTGVTLNV